MILVAGCGGDESPPETPADLAAYPIVHASADGGAIHLCPSRRQAVSSTCGGGSYCRRQAPRLALRCPQGKEGAMRSTGTHDVVRRARNRTPDSRRHLTWDGA
jgi:hypothetical protein